MLTTRDKILLTPFWIISLLPFWLLYRISDFLFVLAFYIVRYRRDVVIINLRNSFPEKDSKEIKKISRKFYQHLCDIFVESLKMLTVSPSKITKRFSISNPESIDELFARNLNLIVGTSHFANWEWGSVFMLEYNCKALAVYRPLSSKFFNRFFKHLRSRFGAELVPMKQTLREIITAKRNNEKFAAYLLGDQRPGKDDLSYWTDFLHQETPVITGIEKLAKKFNLAVVFMDVEKIKRGYYITTFRLITDNAGNEEENAISKGYMNCLETMIKRQAPYWLWSHKRWKYKKGDFINQNL